MMWAKHYLTHMQYVSKVVVQYKLHIAMFRRQIEEEETETRYDGAHQEKKHKKRETN